MMVNTKKKVLQVTYDGLLTSFNDDLNAYHAHFELFQKRFNTEVLKSFSSFRKLFVQKKLGVESIGLARTVDRVSKIITEQEKQVIELEKAMLAFCKPFPVLSARLQKTFSKVKKNFYDAQAANIILQERSQKKTIEEVMFSRDENKQYKKITKSLGKYAQYRAILTTQYADFEKKLHEYLKKGFYSHLFYLESNRKNRKQLIEKISEVSKKDVPELRAIRRIITTFTTLIKNNSMLALQKHLDALSQLAIAIQRKSKHLLKLLPKEEQ